MMENELRLAVIFRADLPEMTRGKAEVQFGHAVLGCLLDGECDDELRAAYLLHNQPKVSLEADGLASIEKIAARATARGVPHYVVTDAARTCFDAPTVTCIAVGPMTKTDSNAITRGARMR